MEFSYLPNHALEALVALVTMLFAGLLMLIPNQSFLARGIVALALGLLNWILMTSLQISILRKEPATYRRGSFSFFVLYQLAAISMIGAGSILLAGGRAFAG